MITLGDAFAGIGMWSHSLAGYGVTSRWSAEIDDKCRQVLTKRFPNTFQYEDVIQIWNPTPVDIFSAGWPCQDLSSATMTGEWLGGERSGLFSEVARLIGTIHPKLVLLENVAVLRQRGLDHVLATLASLGYDADWDTIAAADLGALHIRERIWIAAWPIGVRLDLALPMRELPRCGWLRSGCVKANPSRVDPSKRPKMRWPTPTYADGYGGPGRQGREGGMNLRTAIRERGHLGPPNPEFVEWLMGIPVGWTDLSCSEPKMWPWNYKTVFPPPTVIPRSVKDRGWRVGAAGNSHVPAVAEYFAKPYIERIF